jgi:ubiquinone/menaquinone biosynthesis C-methylase UbiE
MPNERSKTFSTSTPTRPAVDQMRSNPHSIQKRQMPSERSKTFSTSTPTRLAVHGSNEGILAVQCGYMLPLLKARLLKFAPKSQQPPESGSQVDDTPPTFHLLDVGCGSGTSTRALAVLLASCHPTAAQVTGVDISSAILVSAQIKAEAEGLHNVRFLQADIAGSATRDEESKGRRRGILADFIRSKVKKASSRSRDVEEEVDKAVIGTIGLPFERNSFDVVHCHQVLAHVARPVEAIREMMRVVKRRNLLQSTSSSTTTTADSENSKSDLGSKPGGMICLREGDLTTVRITPPSLILDECFKIIRTLHSKQGGEPAAGRFLPDWAREAIREEEKGGAESKSLTTALRKSIGSKKQPEQQKTTTHSTPAVTATQRRWHGGATRADREAYGGHWPGRCRQGLFCEEAVEMGVER